ncbi:MAG: hypothetical protein H6744_13845 [Deltaproteobacteria bacterium]|nr:hypothetical protein [Deltaproteobacteria bacterium]
MKRMQGMARLGMEMAAAALLVMAGCDDGTVAKGDADADTGAEVTGDVASVAPVEVTGTWDTQFDSREVITETTWSEAALVEWDNDANWAITRNADDAAFDPGTFSVLVWTEPSGGTFYYCLAAFGLESQDAARAADRSAPDPSDPEAGGCGGFAWTRMTAAQ